MLAAPSPGPSLLACDEELHEIRLVDEPIDAEAQNRTSIRPACFRSLLHEIAFVSLAMLAGSSFLVLQRVTALMAYAIKLNLRMTTSQVVWTMGAPG